MRKLSDSMSDATENSEEQRRRESVAPIRSHSNSLSNIYPVANNIGRRPRSCVRSAAETADGRTGMFAERLHSLIALVE